MTSPQAQVERAVAALAAGGVAIVGTDTVYGLVAPAGDAAAIARIYALKDRPPSLPLALLAADVKTLLELLPELDSAARRAISAVLPGPYTLVVPQPGRFETLRAGASGSLGVRVPRLPANARSVLARTGPVASTSANRHGDPDPAAIADIPDALAAAVDAVVDDGALPGTASTVVDLTGAKPRVLREGAVPERVAIEALGRFGQ